MSLLDKLGLRDKLNFDDLYNRFLGLEKQQQTLVSVGLVVALILILILPVTFFSSKLGEKKEGYLDYVKKASEFYAVINEYKKFNDAFNEIKEKTSKLGSDPIKGILYGITDELGIERQMVELKTVTAAPESNSSFTDVGKDVSIDNIRFDQTIKLLEKLVNYQEVPIRIKKLDIKMDQKNKQLMKSLNFTASIMKPNKSD